MHIRSLRSQTLIITFLHAPLLNKRLRISPLGPVLGHQRRQSLNADDMSQIHLHLCIMHLPFQLLQGKMRFYLIISISCLFYQSTSTKIKPELKRNILNFGYGINYKYEGMLVDLFDRFYVVTKFFFAFFRGSKVF